MFAPAAQPSIAPVFLSTQHQWSLGPGLRGLNANPASVAWGTANQARYVPFRLPQGGLVVKLWAHNGATTGGNTDIAIYTRAGVEVVSIAAAAQAGTSVLQSFDVTDTFLPPGQYWFGLLNTTTTGTYFGYSSLPYAKLLGMQSQAVGAGNLPTTATFAVADAIIPMVGLSLRVLI